MYENRTLDVMMRLNKKNIRVSVIRVSIKINIFFYFTFIKRFIDNDFEEQIIFFLTMTRLREVVLDRANREQLNS